MTTVVIFDSGVGGLSVYQEVVKKCPNHDYVFVSDNEAFPYGTKTEHALVERVLGVIDRVNRQWAPDILIVACNTASTVVLPVLRQLYDFPIVGVVPAIKPAARMSETKTIGLLATPGTIKRTYTKDLIQDFASDCHVICVGSSRMVELAEQKIKGIKVDLKDIEVELAPFVVNAEIDFLVLACTHFPLLNNELISFFKSINKDVQLIDSGSAVAKRVLELTHNKAGQYPRRIAVFTKKSDSFSMLDYFEKLGFAKNCILKD